MANVSFLTERHKYPLVKVVKLKPKSLKKPQEKLRWSNLFSTLRDFLLSFDVGGE